ncbi:hypothetical protein [Bradyrhizobium zhanjiangense]|uniref:hypothetical protein n=1 Tax=Bradyrhizobium zhanjiangense TaxID=1325107 RepID=UPI0019D7015F|nr:hypothetical protein [Bradyrhizobium zhanjiangense]
MTTDFKANVDHIQIDDTLFANFAAVQAHAASDGHGNTVISYGANDTSTLPTPSAPFPTASMKLVAKGASLTCFTGQLSPAAPARTLALPPISSWDATSSALFDDHQLDLRFPVERQIQIPEEDLPLRAVIQFTVWLCEHKRITAKSRDGPPSTTLSPTSPLCDSGAQVRSQVAVKLQAESSSIRNSARLAWYLAAALLVSDPCMSSRPLDVQRYHLNVRRRCLRWISKSGR